MTDSSTFAPPYHLFQFRLRTLLIFTTAIALICVALKFPNDHWVALTRGLMLISLLSAVLLAIYRTHQTRATALGYSIFCADSWFTSMCIPIHGTHTRGPQALLNRFRSSFSARYMATICFLPPHQLHPCRYRAKTYPDSCKSFITSWPLWSDFSVH